MKSAGCGKTVWSGREAFRLYAAGYESVVVPSLGANAISLKTTVNGQNVDILRTPPDGETLLNDPYAYGVPILFPANRVAGGKYVWDGVTYDFPRNYPNDVHIHGVLHNREWPVAGFGAENGRAWVRFTLDTDLDGGLRGHFPVSMAIHLEISLDVSGLTHSFTVQNKSRDKGIPVGLAYHTAFRTDFCGSREGVKLHVPLLGRCIDDPVDRLPNGKTCPLDGFETGIATLAGADPLETVVDALYTAKPGTSDAVFRDAKNRCEVVYHAGPENHYWILWNKTATEGFIAVEPQTWLSNAMHRPSPQEFGAVIVKPGGSWQSKCSISARSMKE